MVEQLHKSTSQFTLLISNAVLGAFLFGYSTSYMNPAIHTADVQFDIKGKDEGGNETTKSLINGLINALPAIGAIFGAVFSAKLANAFGIRASFVLADLICVVGFLFQLPIHIGTLFIGRFIIGLSVGLNSSLVPLYIKEFSPEILSGPFGAMFQMTINIGALVALIMGMFFAADGSSLSYFRFVIDFPMLICALRIICLAYFFRDDPPPVYLRQKKYSSARAVIKQYYQYEHVERVYNELKSEVDAKLSEMKSENNDKQDPSNSQRLLVGIGLQIIQQFSGINAVLIYSSGLFTNITGGNNSLKNWLNIILGLVNLGFSIIAIGVLKRFGRRPLLLYGAGACSLFLFLVAIIAAFIPEEYDSDNIPTSAILVIVFLFMYLAAFQLSLGPVVWIYDADVLNQAGMSKATTANWLSCAFVAQFFGLINNQGMPLSFGIFCGFCSIGTIFIWKFVLETKGKSPQEIDKMFLLKGKVQELED